jgi:hypothetical protein
MIMFATSARRFGLLVVLVSYCGLAMGHEEAGDTPKLAARPGSVVAHWRLVSSDTNSDAGESVIKDLTGNGHDGRLFGGQSSRSVTFPMKGAPLSFDGGRKRVFIPDDPAFHLTESLTIEAYIAVDRYPSAASLAQIVFRGDDRPGHDPWFLAITRAGKLKFLIANENNVASVLQSPDPIPMGPLVHVAATIDHRSGRQSLLINHKLVATTTTKIRPAGRLSGNRPGIGIGNWAVFSHQAFAGTIHGVRISSRALTASQLQIATATPASDTAVKPTASITVVGGVRLYHSIRLDRLTRGATVSIGQGDHQFVDVRPPLLDLYYTNRHPYQGATRFLIEKSQTVHAAFYGQSWGQGGNGSGNWRHEINSPEQLEAMGWKRSGQLRVEHSDPKLEEQPAWIVYSRYCRQGESFTLRNHKYQAPILIWGHTEGAKRPTTQPAVLGFDGGSALGGFGPGIGTK